MGIYTSYAVLRKCCRGSDSLTTKDYNIQEMKDMIREYEEEIAKLYGVPKHLLGEVRKPKNEKN